MPSPPHIDTRVRIWRSSLDKIAPAGDEVEREHMLWIASFSYLQQLPPPSFTSIVLESQPCSLHHPHLDARTILTITSLTVRSEKAMTNSDSIAAAREKLQGMWSSMKAMSSLRFTSEENETTSTKLTKLKKTMEGDLELAYKAMFGSCTGETTESSPVVQPPIKEDENILKPQELEESTSPSREKEEFFYSQFLQDERHRAAQAVTSLQNAKTNTIESPRTPDRSIPKPFSKSSPSPRYNSAITPTQVTEIYTTLESPMKVPIAADLSFDDEISAISAHTLDEMARLSELVKSRRLCPVHSDLTSDGFETFGRKLSNEESSYFITHTPSREGPEKLGLISPQTSPLGLGKPRSFGTINSNRSKGNRSAHTKSTQSSQSTQFETVWRKDERKYWHDVVNDETEQNLTNIKSHLDKSTKGIDLRVRSRESVSLNIWIACASLVFN